MNFLVKSRLASNSRATKRTFEIHAHTFITKSSSVNTTTPTSLQSLPPPISFVMSAQEANMPAAGKSKKFGKSGEERHVPHHSTKAKKYYPAEDVVAPKKVRRA
jgi:hypothetical protein